MTVVSDRYALWLDAVRDLLDQDTQTFPRAVVAQLMAETFDVGVVTWNWMESDGSLGTEFDRDSIPWDPQCMSAERAREITRRHPLAQWFMRTQDPRPTSLGRVPRSIARPEDFAMIVDEFGSHGQAEQISIPYRLGVAHYRSFILARADDDFSDDDVDLSGRVQPLLALLERQVSVTGRRNESRVADAGLTPREVAVLALLADGLTAGAIAHRLAISARTVHNHLQHIYRKLGVADRMRAVLVAQSLGLVSPRGQRRLAPIEHAGKSHLPAELRRGTPLGGFCSARFVFPAVATEPARTGAREYA